MATHPRGLADVAARLRRRHPGWSVLHATDRRVTLLLGPTSRILIGIGTDGGRQRAYVEGDGAVTSAPGVAEVLRIEPAGHRLPDRPRTIVWNSRTVGDFLAAEPEAWAEAVIALFVASGSTPTKPAATEPAPPHLMPAALAQIARRLPQGVRSHNILGVAEMPERAAVYADRPADLHPVLGRALDRKQITLLYRHQREAWDLARGGRDLVVVTPTASGKTLAFNLPVLQACLEDPTTKAVYFYPTKALANDQLAALSELLGPDPTVPTLALYHGDLEPDERERVIRRPPNILLATPDILHWQQLPRHREWRQWWSQLRFVVIDEAHAYRGVFGSHIAHVMRRLLRVADRYGANPIVLAASATIGNPGDHLRGLTGRTPTVIDADGAPQVGRDVVIWDPLTFDASGAPVAPAKAQAEAARLFVAALLEDHSVILFARSRRGVERIVRVAKRDLARAGRADLADRVVGYRAGLAAARRREMELGLRDGSIRGVVATVALELGVDIGSLDVAVLATYPGSTMSFRQQAGRAGRRGGRALVIMIASRNPLSRHFADRPRELTEASPESAAIDLANPRIADGQLLCAAREMPLTERDEGRYGAWMSDACTRLEASGRLRAYGSRWEVVGRAGLPGDVSLRSIEGSPYELLSDGVHIGDMDQRYLAREAHVNAIYVHDGETYRVLSVDHDRHHVRLEARDEGILTEPKGTRYIDELGDLGEPPKRIGPWSISLARLRVTTTYTQYQEIDEETGARRGAPVPIEPKTASSISTEGLVLEVDPATPTEGLHTLEHLMRALAPLTVLCDRNDLDGHMDPEIRHAYVFDRTEGGVGLSIQLFRRIAEVLRAARDRLNDCDCEEGCPRCIQIADCMLENEELSKSDMLGLLAATPM